MKASSEYPNFKSDVPTSIITFNGHLATEYPSNHRFIPWPLACIPGSMIGSHQRDFYRQQREPLECRPEPESCCPKIESQSGCRELLRTGPESEPPGISLPSKRLLRRCLGLCPNPSRSFLHNPAKYWFNRLQLQTNPNLSGVDLLQDTTIAKDQIFSSLHGTHIC